MPATSANLGPGFDALGLALGWYDDVSAAVLDGPGLDIEIEGTGADDLPRDERHLVVRAMTATFQSLGTSRPGLALRCVNRIPHGRGLGSSAAAVVAGVLLARALVADGPERLDDAAVLALASGLEGHPDNAAAALLGGV
ncbi:MAG: homoserine kinase, partial [Actinomycetota bacterium]|nr:homoserine kinase [Actinomycetota bacterium]